MKRYVLEDETIYPMHIEGAEKMGSEDFRRERTKLVNEWYEKLRSAITSNMDDNNIYLVAATGDEQLTILSKGSLDITPFNDLYKKISVSDEPQKEHGIIVREFGGSFKYDGKKFSNRDIGVKFASDMEERFNPLILTDKGLVIVDAYSLYNKFIPSETVVEMAHVDGIIALKYKEGGRISRVEIRATDTEMLNLIEDAFDKEISPAMHYSAGRSFSSVA